VREAIASASVFLKTSFFGRAARDRKTTKISNPFPVATIPDRSASEKTAFACRRQKVLRAALFIADVPITTPKRLSGKEFLFALTEK
jgi:hypothetical protein